MRRVRSTPPPPAPEPHVGVVLRQWRAVRHLSQLELALEAGVSSRHLSFVETGKAQPSRDMVARLADTLGMPLRERNALFLAAGYSPPYWHSDLGALELVHVRRAIELILNHQEPFPAFVLNRRWDVLQSNRAAIRVGQFLIGGSAHTNMLRRFFDPRDMRAVVVNWEEIAGAMIHHLHEDIALTPSDDHLRGLLAEILRYPGVPSRWHDRAIGAAPPPLLTIVCRNDRADLRFFSTITTFGTPRDVTLEELRIECVFPGDDETAELCRALAAADDAARAV